MEPLDPRVVERIVEAHRELTQRGDLLPPEALQAGYDAFRQRFGPERLRSLDGAALLNLMHTHGNKDSLVYWLEFKNDDEFPGRSFGSIAGGSAHKFGIFRRKEPAQWVAGSPQTERSIDTAEAVKIAHTHRDQLLAGVEVLSKFPVGADDAQCLELQRKLDEVAPYVSAVAWGHKYFSLMFPEKLDDYHRHDWQRYNLIAMLQIPPAEEGLYTCAGRYAQIARQFNWPMNHLTTVLHEVSGEPKKYWRIGTRLGNGDDDGEDIWPAMRDGSYAAIGWHWVGDLTSHLEADNLKDEIFKRLKDEPEHRGKRTAKAGEIRNFAQRIQNGDVVLASDGQRVLGLGVVTGDYRFENTAPTGAPHRRGVEWKSVEPWKMPVAEGLRTTVFQIRKNEENLIEVEKRLLGSATHRAAPAVQVMTQTGPQLSGVPRQVQAILERKGQVILFGPPGTGKTYWARKSAADLAAIAAFGRLCSELSATERAEIEGAAENAGLVRVCTFHPAYGYEDFIEGYRPETNAAGQLSFRLREGVFKRLCRDAAANPSRQFFLLIDEINRGDIPRIFGELLTLLEFDKRGMTVSLPVSGESFAVPKNVRVIGTMNTADKSIAVLDTALRRRFGFVELLPDIKILGATMVGNAVPLGPWLAALNERIRNQLGRDARNLQIGHAYFLHDSRPVSDFAKFVRILAEDIVPLMQEYCYEDFGALEKLLGAGLVDGGSQTIRESLFEPANRDQLVQALLAPSPDIVTATAAKPTETTEDENGSDDA